MLYYPTLPPAVCYAILPRLHLLSCLYQVVEVVVGVIFVVEVDGMAEVVVECGILLVVDCSLLIEVIGCRLLS